MILTNIRLSVRFRWTLCLTNQMVKRVKVSAPGKIILSGEHAVVYGCPALLSAVNKRLTITQWGDKKKISSDIPIGCGMGSSAAFAVASSALNIKLKGKKWDLEEINKEAYKMEKRQHGNPSGGDNTISTYGGFLWYRKESEQLKIFSPIRVKIRLPKFYIINTGKPYESTKDMILIAAELKERKPRRFENIINKIGIVTKSFLKYFTNEEKMVFSELIKENERLLEDLGVVSKSTAWLIRKIEKIGGAAKISGAGGRKLYSGILLVCHPDEEKLLNFAKDEHLNIFPIRLGEEGVKNEKTN